MTSNRNQQALVDFMMEKLGGKDSVYKEFYGHRILELAQEGATLEELFKEAREGGWADELANMRLKLLANTIFGNFGGEHAPKARPGDEDESGGKRLSAQEVAEIHDQILVYLADHPWAGKPAISAGVKVPSKKLSARLRALRSEKKIQSHGEKAAMRYALASERSKPKD